MNYRILVICASEKRKKDTQAMFDFFDIKAPIVYFDASTPANSAEYLNSLHVDKTNLGPYCCGYSHMRAITDSSKEYAPDFTIIVEDDLAINDNFIPVIEEFANNWELYMKNDTILHIGWQPQTNYTRYLNKKQVIDLKSVFGYKLVNTMQPYGLQAYMIRKKDLFPLVRFFNHTNFDSFYNYIRSQNVDGLNLNKDLRQCDYFIPIVLRPRVIVPPIALERQTESILKNNGSTNEIVLASYFQEYETLRKDYYGNNLY